MSNALLRAAPRDLDPAIERWLGRLARRVGADRASVLQLSAEGGSLHTTHTFCPEGAPAFPVMATATDFAWLVRQVRDARAFWSPRAATDRPATAERERCWSAADSTPYALVPFAVEGAVTGAVAFSVVAGHGSWSDPLVASLESSAQIIGNAVARRHAWHALQERISFEHLLAHLAGAVRAAPAEELDAEIRRGLEQVVGHFGIERCSVLTFAPTGAELSVTHSARAIGAPAMRSVADVPVDAAAERQDDRASAFRSHLTIPLTAAGAPWGALAVSACLRPRDWSSEEVQRLELLGNIIMNALLARQAQDDRDRRRDELAHAARLAALGELTAALAHELNQPLMAIRLNAQATRRMLLAGEPTDADEVLEDIAADATRAGDLIRRLRDLLRRRELAKELLDINEVIDAVAGIAKTEAGRHGAQVVVEAAAGLPRVLGDAIQLQQVILNLVRNAAQAMSAETAPREVQLRAWATEQLVTVSVEDAGPPMDDETLRRMFTPFSTTKPGGLGIGLAISRSIVEAHGGRLWAERRLDRGLAVRFALPLPIRAMP